MGISSGRWLLMLALSAKEDHHLQLTDQSTRMAGAVDSRAEYLTRKYATPFETCTLVKPCPRRAPASPLHSPFQDVPRLAGWLACSVADM